MAAQDAVQPGDLDDPDDPAVVADDPEDAAARIHPPGRLDEDAQRHRVDKGNSEQVDHDLVCALVEHSREPSPRPDTVATSSLAADRHNMDVSAQYADVSVNSRGTCSTYPGASQRGLSDVCGSAHTGTSL